jgi:cellulose synthase operon protein C
MSRLHTQTLALLILLLVTGSGHAKTLTSIFETHLSALERPQKGWALWHLFEAHRLRRAVSGGPERLQKSLSMVQKRRRLPDLLRGEALAIEAILQAELASTVPSQQMIRIGMPTTAAFLGPLRGPGLGSDRPTYPEKGATDGVYGATAWRLLESGTLPASLQNGDLVNCGGDCHAVLRLALQTTKDTNTTLSFSSNGPFSAWLDGKPLSQWDGSRMIRTWQNTTEVRLAAGHHTLEVRFGHREEPPQLRVRAVDNREGLLKHSRWVRPTFGTSNAGFELAKDKGHPILGPFARKPDLSNRLILHVAPSPEALLGAAVELQELMTQKPGDTELALLAARVLKRDANKARQALEKASSLSGHTHPVALAALVALERSQRRVQGSDRRCRDLVEVDPNHPTAVECVVSIHSGGLGMAGALAALRKRMTGTASIEVDLLVLDLLIQNQRHVDASRLALRLSRSLGGHVGLLRRAARFNTKGGRRDDTLDGILRARTLRPYNVDLANLHGETLSGKARDRATKGTFKDSFSVLNKAIALQPNAPSLYEARGRLHIELGNRASGLDDIDRSLSMRPQNQRLALWRRSLVSERTLADEHAVDVNKLIESSAAIKPAAEGATILLDKQVVKFHANALSTRWRQRVIRIDGGPSGEKFETVRLPFTPRVNRLQVLQAEIHHLDGSKSRPQSIQDERPPGKQQGIYTLAAYKVIRLPKLRMGDVLHVQTRTADIGDRNLFGPYFGGVFPTQDQWPILRAEVVVDSPSGSPTTGYTQGPGTWAFEESTHGDPASPIQRRTWTVIQVPALSYEPQMPGYSDMGGLVSVTSFRSWTQLVNWYRGFVRDQLTLSPTLKAVAKKLILNKNTLEAKVRAVHNWVTSNTRYVGIEFGIHGFKPYALTEIVQRGYGDCKDKAALFVSMLQAVGIPAEFVLIRTRDRGTFAKSPPSLWIFNHAIAYVPGLRTYVDATSELASLGEVPALDQGATVLHFPLFVEEGGPYQVRQAPFTAPESNRLTSSARIALNPKGHAQATFNEEFTGTMAASMRLLFQNKSQQKKILSRLLASNYPGALLLKFAVSGAEQESKSVGLELGVSIPKFARLEEGGLSIPVHADPASALQRNAPLASRGHPLNLRHLSMETTEATIQLPAGWTAAAVPATVLEANPYADYRFSVREENGSLMLQETLRFKKAIIPPADYPEFRRFLQSVTRHRGTRLMVKPANTAR